MEQEGDVKQNAPDSDHHPLTVPKELMDAAKRWSAQAQRHHYQKEDTETDSTSDIELALPPNPLRKFLREHCQEKKNGSSAMLFFNPVSCVQS